MPESVLVWASSRRTRILSPRGRTVVLDAVEVLAMSSVSGYAEEFFTTETQRHREKSNAVCCWGEARWSGWSLSLGCETISLLCGLCDLGGELLESSGEARPA